MICAGEIATRPSIEGAIDRGLKFLARDALAWKAEHDCSSCHHAALVLWAMNEGKQRGHLVDEPVLEQLTKWLTEGGDGRTSVPRPASAPRALNTKAIYYALGLASVPKPNAGEREALSRFLDTVKADQLENGGMGVLAGNPPAVVRAIRPSNDHTGHLGVSIWRALGH